MGILFLPVHLKQLLTQLTMTSISTDLGISSPLSTACQLPGHQWRSFLYQTLLQVSSPGQHLAVLSHRQFRQPILLPCSTYNYQSPQGLVPVISLFHHFWDAHIPCPLPPFSFIFLIFYLFTFRERGREVKREGEKHQCVRLAASHTPPIGDLAATQACTLTGNRTGNLLACRPELNPLSHTSQGLSLRFSISESGHILPSLCLKITFGRWGLWDICHCLPCTKLAE